MLLLNTVLTVREGAPSSHRGKGGEPFTRQCCVFLTFGAQATAMAQKLVDTKKNVILSAPHPSPLNGNRFVEAVKSCSAGRTRF